MNHENLLLLLLKLVLKKQFKKLQKEPVIHPDKTTRIVSTKPRSIELIKAS